MKKIAVILISCCALISCGFSKVNDSVTYPQIGEPCPDFTLSNVEHYTKSTVSLSDFRGKWLILDFWGEYCVSCVESFPKLNDIQQKFNDDIQILLVGIPYKDPASIKRLFELHRKQKNLNLPISYNKELSQQFGVGTYPHIVIIDPRGIVRHITYQFDGEQIAAMIANEPVTLPKSYGLFDWKPYVEYDTKIPLLINGNGGEQTAYLFRSILTETNELTPPLFNIESDNRFEAMGFTLESLYKYAYGGFFTTFLSSNIQKYGEIWPKIVFETRDTAIFFSDIGNRGNLYSYSVHVSDSYFTRFGKVKFNFRKVLQSDLLACFPYEVIVERRMMPCNELKISNDDLSKIKSSYKDRKSEDVVSKRTDFETSGFSFFALISQISNSPGYPRDVPLVYYGDEADIDISIESIYYEDRLQELKKYGFSIVRSEKEMDVIIVRDKQSLSASRL